jgi:hypothetical protein
MVPLMICLLKKATQIYLTCCCQEEKQVDFLEWDFPFQQGKRIFVALATKKMKKHYM